MPSVFTLQGPQLGITTAPQLDLLTSSPQAVLAVLKDMETFLQSGSDLQVLVAKPTVKYGSDFTKGKIVDGAGPYPEDLPFALPSMLWISADTFALWDHALKRSTMSGGLALLAAPPELIGIFMGSLGLAENQLIGVKAHVAAIEKSLGISPNKTRNTILGVVAGVALLVGGIALVHSRRGQP